MNTTVTTLFSHVTPNRQAEMYPRFEERTASILTVHE